MDSWTAGPEKQRDVGGVGDGDDLCVSTAAHGGSSSALGLRQALTRKQLSYSRLRLATSRAALARCLPGFVRAVMRSTRRCTAPALPALLPCRPAALPAPCASPHNIPYPTLPSLLRRCLACGPIIDVCSSTPMLARPDLASHC